MFGFELTWTGAFLLSSYAVIFTVIVACMFCDLEEGPFSSVVTVLFDSLPKGISKGLRFVVGNRVASAVEGCVGGAVSWGCYKRNPLLQIFYLAVVLGAYAGVVQYGYPMLPCRYLPAWHRYTAAGAVLFCVYLWWLACTVSPGLVTPENHHVYLDNYAPEKYLYPAGRVCPTALFVKPARSKYCRLMCAHVARFDHFCPWLNQSVGMENYRFFLAFLFAHCLLLTYGAVGMAGLLASEAVDRDLFNAEFYNSATGVRSKASFAVVLQFLMFQHWGVFAVALLCGVMAIVLLGFTVYHLWLASRNVTTNESYKWADLKKAWLKYEARRQQQLARRAMRAAAARAAAAACDEVREGDFSAEAVGHEDGEDDESSSDEEGTLPYETFPLNPYDRGVWANLWEVASPLSLRRGGPVRDPGSVRAHAEARAEQQTEDAEEEEKAKKMKTAAAGGASSQARGRYHEEDVSLLGSGSNGGGCSSSSDGKGSEGDGNGNGGGGLSKRAKKRRADEKRKEAKAALENGADKKFL
jgi:palmitoyltransferase